MSPFTKTLCRIGAACLLGVALALPASAAEPEVELRCEFRPTRAGLAAAEARRFHEANAAILRREIADELASRRRAEQAEFSPRPAALPVAVKAH